jgi:hypothetical protein
MVDAQTTALKGQVSRQAPQSMQICCSMASTFFIAAADGSTTIATEFCNDHYSSERL